MYYYTKKNYLIRGLMGEIECSIGLNITVYTIADHVYDRSPFQNSGDPVLHPVS